jgi:hypothetical protein
MKAGRLDDHGSAEEGQLEAVEVLLSSPECLTLFSRICFDHFELKQRKE